MSDEQINRTPRRHFSEELHQPALDTSARYGYIALTAMSVSKKLAETDADLANTMKKISDASFGISEILINRPPADPALRERSIEAVPDESREADIDSDYALDRLSGLSPREREVLTYSAAGLAYTKIATRLHKSNSWVSDIAKSGLKKLGIKHEQLGSFMLQAQEAGLITTSEAGQDDEPENGPGSNPDRDVYLAVHSNIGRKEFMWEEEYNREINRALLVLGHYSGFENDPDRLAEFRRSRAADLMVKHKLLPKEQVGEESVTLNLEQAVIALLLGTGMRKFLINSETRERALINIKDRVMAFRVKHEKE